MSAYATIGRMAPGTPRWVSQARVAVSTLGTGLAAGAPRAPLAADDPAPAVPFDPGALINAINDYASLLSLRTEATARRRGCRRPTVPPPSQTPTRCFPGCCESAPSGVVYPTSDDQKNGVTTVNMSRRSTREPRGIALSADPPPHQEPALSGERGVPATPEEAALLDR